MIGEKSCWDKGYGTETMRLLLEHGFNTLNLHRIWLQVFAKNKRGIRAYEKAGFQFEGTFRDADYQHGQYQDVHFMSVINDEWQNWKQNDENK
jgi:RimJ/RimL family protein N-acetyltransferase